MPKVGKWATNIVKDLYRGSIAAVDVSTSALVSPVHILAPYGQPRGYIFDQEGNYVGSYNGDGTPSYDMIKVTPQGVSYEGGINYDPQANKFDYNEAANVFEYDKFFFGSDVNTVKDKQALRKTLYVKDAYNVAKRKKLHELGGSCPVELGTRLYYVENNAHHGVKIPFSGGKTIGSSFDPRDMSFGLLIDRLKDAFTYRIREKYQNVIESKLTGTQKEEALQKNMGRMIGETIDNYKSQIASKIQSTQKRPLVQRIQNTQAADNYAYAMAA